MRGQGGLVGGVIGIMIVAIILFSAALPTIIENYNNIKDNLSTGERAVASLITLFLILGVVVAIGRMAGMV